MSIFQFFECLKGLFVSLLLLGGISASTTTASAPQFVQGPSIFGIPMVVAALVLGWRCRPKEEGAAAPFWVGIALGIAFAIWQFNFS